MSNDLLAHLPLPPTHYGLADLVLDDLRRRLTHHVGMPSVYMQDDRATAAQVRAQARAWEDALRRAGWLIEDEHV